MGSGIFKLFPDNCNVAPSTTVVVPLVAPNALLLCAFKVPLETLIAPLKFVLLPLKNKEPVLSFVKVLPASPVNNPLKNILVPEKTPVFKLLAPNAMVPVVIDKLPASTLILALLVKLIAPVNILFPEILLIAPKLETPKPPIDIGSVLVILF